MLESADVYATIAVSDEAKAKEFYEGVLGLKVQQQSPGGTSYSNGKTGVFVYPSQYAGSNKATTATWMVDDVEAVAAELKSKGVSFEQYDDLPGVVREGDVHIMGGLKAAWFKDPDGNILNITNGMG